MRDDPVVTDLVTRARHGDQHAWDTLVERYAPLVWSICRRYRLSRADTDDVGQTVWLLLVTHLDQLRDPAALPGWIATTTGRECAKARRATQPAHTAVAGLRWLRDRTTCDALARDHGISRATAYRYVDEVIAVLAAQAPGLHEALERVRDKGFSHVILDGKVIACDRCKEPAISVTGEVIDLWYSGKAHAHGSNIQAVLAPCGSPLWVSDVEPGSVHDITAARRHALPALYSAATSGLPTSRPWL